MDDDDVVICTDAESREKNEGEHAHVTIYLPYVECDILDL
jgi:hypothetical protein